MPSTYTSFFMHFVFSTKNREKTLRQEILPATHAYMGGIAKTLGAVPVEIGGIEDHVHLLLGIRATHSAASLVREIKKASHEWIEQRLPDFAWQPGYGGFTVSPERVNGVRKYIQNQAEHHKTMSFQEEIAMLFKLAGVEFDPKDFE